MSPKQLPTGQRLFIGLQKCLPRRLITRLIYRLTRIRVPWVKNLTIKLFVRAFRVQTNDAAYPVPEGYSSFNEFFTRPLHMGARELSTIRNGLISPCDGLISQCGPIGRGQLLQAKGINYGLSELLGSEADASLFADGRFATIYLAPYDYHRVHCPLDAVLLHERTIGFDLFSVNETTARAIDGLFVRNERRVMLFDSDVGRIAVVMVGAMNVGSITTVWDGETRAGFRSGSTPEQTTTTPNKHFNSGELLGWFNMGSTVIVIMEAQLELSSACQPGRKIRMGNALGSHAQATE